MSKNIDSNKFDSKNAENNNQKKQNKRGNNKNRKSNRKPSSRLPKTTEDASVAESPSNDIAWYSEDPALINAAGNFFYTWPIGHPVFRNYKYKDRYGNSKPWVTSDSQYDNTPGIMVLWTVPTMGTSDTRNSAVNLAANQLYTFVRHQNSGSANEDANDMMLYVASMSSVFSMINFLERLYGSVQLYTQQNRYFPRHLIEAQGVDYDSLANNMADARYQINLLINMAASFAVPSTIRYFYRQAFNFAGYYSEGESIKDQIYLQAPAGTFNFCLDADGAGQIQVYNTIMFQRIGQGKLATFQEVVDEVKTMIRELMSSEDFGIMNGDILKAYGSQNLVMLATMPDDYVVMPSYDQTVLEQFRNATIIRSNVLYNKAGNYCDFGGLYQDETKGYLLSDLQFSKSMGHDAYITATASHLIAALPYTGNTLIQSMKTEPTMEDSIESTRLHTKVKNLRLSDTNYLYGELVPGSDIVVACKMIVLPAQSYSSDAITVDYGDFIIHKQQTTDQLVKQMKHIAWSKSFKFAPICHLWYYDYDKLSEYETLAPDMIPFVDYGNFAVLALDDVERLHEACMLSLLHVASIAKVNGKTVEVKPNKSGKRS
nr:putative capsid [Marmot picobirnavirus]